MKVKPLDHNIDKNMDAIEAALCDLFEDNVEISTMNIEHDVDDGKYEITIGASHADIPFGDEEECDGDCEHCEYAEEIEVDEEEDNVFWGIPDIQRVIFNPPATVVFWMDGSKTVVKCREGDTYTKYAGFSAAVMKKLFGSTRAAMEVMEDCDESEEETHICEAPKKEEKKTPEFKPNLKIDDRLIKAFTLSAILDATLGALKDTVEEAKKDGASSK